MRWLLRISPENWPLIFAVAIAALFFTVIASNGKKHAKYVAAFTVECEARGGIVKVPRGVKGWPQPRCFNPEAIIDIEMN